MRCSWRVLILGCFATIAIFSALHGFLYQRAIERDLEHEFTSCLAAANRGDLAAQYQLGIRLYEGKGVQRNYIESVGWYRQAATRQYGEAEASLGFMYEQGLGVSQNYSQAIDWYRKAVEQGNADAEYNLGTMYRFGRGVTKDDKTALHFYRDAANQGNADGQFALGYIYATGKGVPRDDVEAARLYSQAAGQNQTKAQYNLAIMYFKGQGVLRNRAEAYRLLWQAAKLGEMKAQRSIGYLGMGKARLVKILVWIFIFGDSLILASSFSPNREVRQRFDPIQFAAGMVGLLCAGSYIMVSKFDGGLSEIISNGLTCLQSLLMGVFVTMVIAAFSPKSLKVATLSAVSVLALCDIFVAIKADFESSFLAIHTLCMINGLIMGVLIVSCRFIPRTRRIAQ